MKRLKALISQLYKKLTLKIYKINLKKEMPENGKVTIYPPQDYDFCWMYAKDKTKEEYYIITEHKKQSFLCKTNYTDEKTFLKKEDDVLVDEILFTRYYKAGSKTYHNRHWFVIDQVIQFYKVMYWLKVKANSILQFIANSKRVETKSRIKILKSVKKQHIDDGTNMFMPLNFYTREYGSRAIRRPNKDKELKYITLILDSLSTSGELNKSNGEYIFTGKGLQTLIEYEERDEQRRLNNRQQTIIVFLTIGLLFTGFVQSGLIELDTWLDFKSFSTKAFLKNNNVLLTIIFVTSVTAVTI